MRRFQCGEHQRPDSGIEGYGGAQRLEQDDLPGGQGEIQHQIVLINDPNLEDENVLWRLAHLEEREMSGGGPFQRIQVDAQVV